MPPITDADVQKVKALVTSRDIVAARKFLGTFTGERAARMLAQINEKFPVPVKAKPQRTLSPLMMGTVAAVVIVIIGAVALFALRPRAGGATREMLELYRDICIPLLDWNYETEGVDPMILSEGCMQNAQALYDAAPEAYTACYQAMGTGDNASFAWAMCYSSYNLPTPSSWPIDKVLSTRIVPTDYPTSTPIPPYTSPQDAVMQVCLWWYEDEFAITKENIQKACDEAAPALYDAEQATVDACYARKAGDQFDFKDCFLEDDRLRFDEQYIDEYDPF
jgi:hypothetical protein